MAAFAGVFGFALEPTKVSFFLWQKHCHLDNSSCSLTFSLLLMTPGHSKIRFSNREVKAGKWLVGCCCFCGLGSFLALSFLHFHQLQATIIRMVEVNALVAELVDTPFFPFFYATIYSISDESWLLQWLHGFFLAYFCYHFLWGIFFSTCTRMPLAFAPGPLSWVPHSTILLISGSLFLPAS